jgi:hypothetical protein
MLQQLVVYLCSAWSTPVCAIPNLFSTPSSRSFISSPPRTCASLTADSVLAHSLFASAQMATCKAGCHTCVCVYGSLKLPILAMLLRPEPALQIARAVARSQKPFGSVKLPPRSVHHLRTPTYVAQMFLDSALWFATIILLHQRGRTRWTRT